MAKKINLTYEGQDYELEFTKRTIKQMEDQGFVLSEIDEKPMTYIPMLFAGAFKAHHRFVKAEKIDEIYENIKNRDKLMDALVDMYTAPVLAMVDEPTETAKNVEWSVDE